MIGQLWNFSRHPNESVPVTQMLSEDVTLVALALFRAEIAISTLITLGVIAFEPDSLGAKMFLSRGEVGWYVLAAVACLACWALVDILVNDVLPDRFILRSAMRNRHYVYLGLSGGLLSIAYVYASDGWSMVILRPVFDATIASTIAIFDLFLRHRWRLSDDYQDS